MAKGNLFLGTAARSVGDVVMYRREGSQVSRVRVRKIANPKTEAQCRQRAYMAPIPKFFSPLAVVLERSFEGLSKSKSYSKFLKVNADKARANDWLLPKGIGFFPLPYQLSQGTIPSLITTLVSQTHTLKVNNVTAGSSPQTMGALADILIENGYSNGDVVTLIGVSGSVSTGFATIVEQFIVDSTSEDTIATTLKHFSPSVDGAPSGHLAFNGQDFSIMAGAVIIARFENDKWRRSTQTLIVDESVMTTIGADAYKAAAIASYSNTVGEPNPMVYLDGDELDNA